MLKSITYALDMEKTKGLNTGFNCLVPSAFDEMITTKNQFRKNNGRMFYQFVQSFPSDTNLTPQQINQIGLEFVAKQFPNFEAIISTHQNTENLHNHIIINSVNFETGKKLHQNHDDLVNNRKINDEICLKFGDIPLTIYSKNKRENQMSSKEYRSALKGESWKFKLINTIDDCMRFSKSKEHFKKLMQSNGYQVKWEENRKSITYTCPNGMKCRDNKLHQERYLKIRMEREFELRQQRIEQIERFKQAEQLQMDGAEYRLYIRQSAVDSGYAEQITRENTLDKLQGGTTREPTSILSGAQGTQTDDRNITEESTTGWEAEREELFQLENSDRNNSAKLHNVDRSNNFFTNQTPTRTLTKNLMWSITRLEQAENEDDEMAEILGMVEITALTIAGVYLLIEWLKLKNENDINDEDVENYIETIKQEQENEIDYTPINDMKMGGF
ncbi:MAG: relaxase/mobilization nuclease domain-containing protein [Clostridia bacterium]